MSFCTHEPVKQHNQRNQSQDQNKPEVCSKYFCTWLFFFFSLNELLAAHPNVGSDCLAFVQNTMFNMFFILPSTHLGSLHTSCPPILLFPLTCFPHCFKRGLNAGDLGPKKPAHFYVLMPWRS